MATVRAVYEHGVLRPLEPITLREGEEVELRIAPVGQADELTHEEVERRLKAAGLLVEYNAADWVNVNDNPAVIAEIETMSDDELDEYLEEIGRRLKPGSSIEEYVDEDRGPR